MDTNVSPLIISRNWYNSVITVRNYILRKPVFLSAKVWTEDIKHTNRMKLGIPIQRWTKKKKKIQCTFHLIYIVGGGEILQTDDRKLVRFMLLYVLTTTVTKIKHAYVCLNMFDVRPFTKHL